MLPARLSGLRTENAIRASVRRIRESPLLPDSYAASGFVYDVTVGQLREVALSGHGVTRVRGTRSTLSDEKLTCAECGREATEADAEQEGWRFHSDGLGELIPFCPECAEREFGPASEPL